MFKFSAYIIRCCIYLNVEVFVYVWSTQVFCPLYHKQGCKWEGYYPSLQEHIDKTCVIHPISCIYCRVEHPRGRKDDHLSTCERFPIGCMLCTRVMPRNSMSLHLTNECPDQKVQCIDNGDYLILVVLLLFFFLLLLFIIVCYIFMLVYFLYLFCFFFLGDVKGCGEYQLRKMFDEHKKISCKLVIFSF